MSRLPKIRAPFPQSSNYEAWGVVWIDGVAEVNEDLAIKLINKGYLKVEDAKPKKKKDKE